MCRGPLHLERAAHTALEGELELPSDHLNASHVSPTTCPPAQQLRFLLLWRLLWLLTLLEREKLAEHRIGRLEDLFAPRLGLAMSTVLLGLLPVLPVWLRLLTLFQPRVAVATLRGYVPRTSL